ncbi:MAG: PAS domain S-box protein [Trueperaceae bacterium]
MPSHLNLHELQPQQLNTLLQDVLDGLIVTDPDGNVLYMNAAAESLYGFQHGEPHQRERLNLQRYSQETFILKTLNGQDVPEGEQPLTLALQGRTYKNVELRVHHTKSGEERVFAFSGTRLDGSSPLGVLTIRDVTEQRKADRRYRIAFESNPAPTLIAQLDDSVLVDVNEGFADLTGLPKEQIIGRLVTDLGLLPENGALQQVIIDLREERHTHLLQTTIRHARSRERNVLVSARPIEIDGRACGIFTFVDTTELRDTEKRAVRSATELEAANRELDAFNYSVSHDLRAPLRGIDGFSQVLLEEHGETLDESGRMYLERVRTGAQRMGRLIESLLDISRLSRQELHFVPVNLSALAEEVLAGLHEEEPERHMEVEVAPDLVGYGDEVLLRGVMTTLLENSWKFTRESSRSRIVVGGEEDELRSELMVFVRDNGVGFDPRYADKLFVPFQRLHSVGHFEGEGVGLATAQRIIHRHGGRVWAESAVGEGATFSFTLPTRKPA